MLFITLRVFSQFSLCFERLTTHGLHVTSLYSFFKTVTFFKDICVHVHSSTLQDSSLPSNSLIMTSLDTSWPLHVAYSLSFAA